jgi:hypothetical protein
MELQCPKDDDTVDYATARLITERELPLTSNVSMVSAFAASTFRANATRATQNLVRKPTEVASQSAPSLRRHRHLSSRRCF